MNSSKNIIKLVAVIILAIFLTYGYLYIKNIDKTVLDKKVSVNIPSGSSTKQIAKILYDNKLIKNEFSFIQFVKKEEVATKLRPGSYTFDEGTVTFDTILVNLLRGNQQTDSVTVTIPEGFTVIQIAELLEEKGLTDKNRFLECAANIDIPYNYIEKTDDYKQLEGFLFPETYNIPIDFTDEKIILLMLNEFDSVFNDEYRKKAEEKGLSIKEITTIASLIEREARVDFERPVIAGVIYNRLEIDMPLQIDATIQYILGKQKEKIYYSDLKIESPYNTYLNKGLPPTPIASPGESCIKAALYPDKHDYFYYRTKNDGSGEHNFSKTFSEHKLN